MFVALLLLVLLALAAGAASAYLRSSPSPRARRTRLRIAVERSTPGPQRDAARLRQRVFESLESARGYGGDSPFIGGLLGEATTVGAQLDADLAQLSTQRDPGQIRASLPAARERVEQLTGMVDHIRELATSQSGSALAEGLQALQGSIENEQLAERAGQQSLEALRTGGYLGGGTAPSAIPGPSAHPPAADGAGGEPGVLTLPDDPAP